MTTVPDSCMEHLEIANEVRRLRAELKVDLASGRVNLAETLRAEYEWTRTMRIVDLLLAAPTLGRLKVPRILTALRLSPTQTIGSLTSERREELIACLEERHPKAFTTSSQSHDQQERNANA